MNAVQQLLTEHLDIWTEAEAEKKSGRGRAAGNAASVYGIKKLRELILELAVRGKLVPQDASDEPAGELLKRIQIERSKFVAEGKIKQDKPALIAELKSQFDVPINWELERLFSITTGMDSGWSPACLDNNSPSDNVWGILKTTSVQVMNYLAFENKELPASLTPRPEAEVKAGDILFTRAGPMNRVGISCLVHKTRPKLMISDKIIRFHPIEPGIYGRFLSLCLNAGETAKYLERSKSGMAASQVNISQEKLRATPIPIPPLEEQYRIVAKVDELMALCDQLEARHSDAADAHEQLVSHLLGTLTQSQSAADFNANWQRIAAHFDTLFTTEASIDSLKQTLLQLAVMGKLVAQDANDEPASELLKRIQTEKAKLVREGEIKKDKLISPISKNEKPFELPQNWEWVRVATVSKMITSGSRDWAQYLSDEGAKFITMGNLSRGNYELRLDNIRYVKPPNTGEGSRTKLEAHDVLCLITGEVGNLGRIPENFGEAYINQHTCLLRFLPQCQNRYFPEALRSPMALTQFNAPQRGVKNSFRLGDLSEMVIPLPPLAEQHRIVVRIDELMELCDQLIFCIIHAKRQQQKLADVLVEDAVMG